MNIFIPLHGTLPVGIENGPYIFPYPMGSATDLDVLTVCAGYVPPVMLDLTGRPLLDPIPLAKFLFLPIDPMVPRMEKPVRSHKKRAPKRMVPDEEKTPAYHRRRRINTRSVRRSRLRKKQAELKMVETIHHTRARKRELVDEVGALCTTINELERLVVDMSRI